MRTTRHAYVRDGALSGLYYGVGFAAVTCLAALLDAKRIEERLHASPWKVAPFYLIIGIAIGAAYGVVRPRLRSQFAYLLFGFIVAIPAATFGMILFKGMDYLVTTDGIAQVLIIALLMGPTTASVLRPTN
jgi:hypothetical protein